MRKTLHEFTIEQWEGVDILDDFAGSCQKCYKYAKLTNRQPKLGDFVPCDEEGNVLDVVPFVHEQSGMSNCSNEYRNKYQKALDRVIFKGNWEVKTIIGTNELISDGSNSFIWENGICKHFNKCYKPITHIEDLPREIEFKEEVI